MPILDADLTSGTGFVLEPMNLTDTQKVLVTNIIANIHGNESGIANLAEESQAKLNEVITSINSLKEGTDTDIATLESNINAILYLESEAGNDSFVGLFTKLYTAINEKKEALAFTLDVAESPNGQVLLDLSAYGFQSTDEFEVLPSMVTEEHGRSLGVDFKKVNVNGGLLTIRDKDRLQFGDNPEARYDAATKGAVQVTVVIVRTAVALEADIDTVAGEHVHLGHKASDHITFIADLPNSSYSLAVDSIFAGSELRIDTKSVDADDATLTVVDMGAVQTIPAEGFTLTGADMPATVIAIIVNIDGVATEFPIGGIGGGNGGGEV